MKSKLKIWSYIAVGIFILLIFSILLQSFQGHRRNAWNVFYLQQSVFWQIANAATDEETNQPERNTYSPKIKMLESLIPLIFSAIIGAALAVTGGIWESNRERRIAAQDCFCVFIEIKKLDIPNKDCAIFNNLIKRELWVKFSKLTLFLREGKRIRVKNSITCFCEIDENRLDNQYLKDGCNWRENGKDKPNWKEEAHIAVPENPPARTQLKTDDPRYILRKALDEIIEETNRFF
jgi:hypothetical protein